MSPKIENHKKSHSPPPPSSGRQRHCRGTPSIMASLGAKGRSVRVRGIVVAMAHRVGLGGGGGRKARPQTPSPPTRAVLNGKKNHPSTSNAKSTIEMAKKKWKIFFHFPKRVDFGRKKWLPASLDHRSDHPWTIHLKRQKNALFVVYFNCWLHSMHGSAVGRPLGLRGVLQGKNFLSLIPPNQSN